MRTLSKEDIRRVADEFFAVFSAQRARAFREGGKHHLLEVVVIHLRLGKPLPQWTKDALFEAYNAQPKSWDDVFGRPPGSRFKTKEAGRLHAEVTRAKEHQATDTGLFDEVAKKLGMSAGTTSRRYYAQRHVFDGFDDVADAFEVPLEERDEWLDIILLGWALRSTSPASWELLKTRLKNEKEGSACKQRTSQK
jgi:hypothetical protein